MVIEIQGRKYAENTGDMVASLFAGPVTCDGFWKRYTNGVLLLDGKGEAFAYVANEVSGRRQWFVTATRTGDGGALRFMHGLDDAGRRRLGLDGLGERKEREVARMVCEAAGCLGEPLRAGNAAQIHAETPGPFRVWSMTSNNDEGLTTRLYLTEWQAWEGLADNAFPRWDEALKVTGEPVDDEYNEWIEQDRKHRTELMALIHAGDIAGASAWWEQYWAEELEGTGDSYAIEEHSHPWTFGPQPYVEGQESAANPAPVFETLIRWGDAGDSQGPVSIYTHASAEEQAGFRAGVMAAPEWDTDGSEFVTRNADGTIPNEDGDEDEDGEEYEAEECYRCELPKVCEDSAGRPVCQKHAKEAMAKDNADRDDTPGLDTSMHDHEMDVD